MSENSDFDRNMIPRWRPYRETVKKGELRSANREVIRDSEAERELTRQAEERFEDWLAGNSEWAALDFQNAAILIGRQDWVRAARSHLGERHVAEKQGDNDLKVHRTLEEEVRRLRNEIREYGDDPVRWMDLALAYTNLGNFLAGKKAAIVALAGGRSNRFILRACSRFWVHVGEPDRGHDLLTKAVGRDIDPWVLSAEMATAEAARKNTKNEQLAARVIQQDSFDPRHTSELALELAKVRLNQGWIGRKGKRETEKLIEIGLRVPTESTLAQAAWYARRGIRVPEIRQLPALEGAHEAVAWIRYGEGRWTNSIRACRAWQKEEPYSSRPAILGSYLSAIGTDDYRTSEEFARKGLLSNFDDAMLLNNLVVALVNQGKLAESETYLVRLNQLTKRQGTADVRPVWLATNGLVAFRKGDWALGRALYFEATEKVKLSKNLTDDNCRALALVLVHHAIEENMIDADLSRKLRKEAQELIRKKKRNSKERTPAWVALVEGLLARRLGETTERSVEKGERPTPM